MTKEEFCKELKESQEEGILSVCATGQKYINSLEAENERLKNKVAAYEDERKCLSETITCDADVIYRINKENAELKCLALHAMREYFKAMSALNIWRHDYYGEVKYLHRVIRYDKLTKQYDYAYRKALLNVLGG